MQGRMPTRKRPAPGTSPIVQQQPQIFNNMNYPNMTDGTSGLEDQLIDWSNTGGMPDSGGMTNMASGFSDPSTFDNNYYPTALSNNSIPALNGTPIAPAPGPTSGQLVRRNANQQVVSRGGPPGPNSWEDFGTQNTSGWENEEEDEDLEQKALIAKKEAQEKRKQIPPFVQKLSSFLDESRNTDLIRWSDDGNSFIVLDEDEFAKTLIPELFKHNNYASFVRQLNMYGFHKKVGLADNSMKASEKKTKAPSEYFNKYFKRGRPELLWLIQKPKNNPPREKRKREEDKIKGDSDEEGRKYNEGGESSGNQLTTNAGPNQSQELTTIPKTELTNLRTELQALQRQQKFISSIITQIKRQNDQLYQQASAFQTMHERHESSINAILTFLASFYNRSLEGHGPANLQEIFSHVLPQNQSQHGNIVDVGDLPDLQMNDQNQLQRTPRRPLLLPAPAAKSNSATPAPPARSANMSPRARGHIFPRNPPASHRNTPASAPPAQSSAPSASASPMVKDDAPTPDVLNTLPEAGTDEMLNVINAHNTANSPRQNLDLESTLEQFQQGNSPLTPQQRNDMLSIIANSSKPSGGQSTDVAGPSYPGQGNNVLTSPTPPPLPQLDESAAREQINLLEQMQKDHENRIQNLANRMQPLSPTGTIPGLHGDSSYNVPSDFDLNAFINTEDYFGDPTAASNNANVDYSTLNPEGFDFGVDGSGGFSNSVDSNDMANDPLFGDSAGHLGVPGEEDNVDNNRIENLSSAGTSPAAAPTDDAEDAQAGDTTSNKRRRVNR